MAVWRIVLSLLFKLIVLLTAWMFYYRAILKKRLEAEGQVDKPKLLGLDVPGRYYSPKSFYETFLRSPELPKSIKGIELYERYLLISRILIYTVFVSLVLGIFNMFVNS